MRDRQIATQVGFGDTNTKQRSKFGMGFHPTLILVWNNLEWDIVRVRGIDCGLVARRSIKRNLFIPSM
jgi:hypothetical protein